MQINSDERILDMVRANVSSVLFIEKEKILPTSHFIDDLGADSLDRMSIMLSLEDEFGKKIDDTVISNINTVQDAINIIRKTLGEPE